MCPQLLFYTFYLCWLYIFALWVQIFSYMQNPKNKRPSTLVNQQFPVACHLSETMLWHSAAHFLPPFASSMISMASFLSHARTSLTSPPLMLWSSYTLLFLSVIQEAELTQIPEQLLNGENTTFKLPTIMLRPHPLGSNSFSFSNCSERSSKPVHTFLFVWFFFAVSLLLSPSVWFHLPLIDISSKQQWLIKRHSGECQEPHTHTHTHWLAEKHPLSRRLEL